MVHTLGGSGETAEKIVEMCRRHCDGEFRVIVPNMAKSAGTLVALGADKIVMGYCSELGPIDPQVRITVCNSLQQVSAWTFIHARDNLIAQFNQAKSKNEDPSPYLQQLAAIDPVFVTHCEQLMTFAKQVGRKWIVGRLMVKGERKPKAEQAADKIVAFLSNVEEHITLEVIELEETDEEWQLLWELYVRCEVFLMTNPPPKAKLIETADVSITLT
jgi:membrane-bound ClpP family serine protease